jgi:hypothetical protein
MIFRKKLRKSIPGAPPKKGVYENSWSGMRLEG